MKILFLTIAEGIREISTRGVYKDLMRKFHNEGHEVFIATPSERRSKEKTGVTKVDGVNILIIKTLNITQVNFIEKGLATLLIEYQFIRALKKYLSDVHFDLVLYSTPPVTFARVIRYIKGKDNALSYLLLKDIFPQNAVDLGMIRRNSLIHKYFRNKEKNLYAVSDFIGCMSRANVDYILRHNPEIDPGIVEVNPNSIEPLYSLMEDKQRSVLRRKYKIPGNKMVFIYGGSFGKPQGISFLIEVLDSQICNKDVFFVLVGAGTEYSSLKSWFDRKRPGNVLLLTQLPKNEFDMLLQSCDIGMIFLDKRFTIPNFPSRLLSYLECKMPVIAATDRNTDLGTIIEENSFGLWSESGDLDSMKQKIQRMALDPLIIRRMGQNGYNYLLKNYTISNSYFTICKHLPGS
ncbi:MAG: glycosyltransferase family 4 protein [Bacteroidales bacterium]|nr:glycosyltransferase family 4 protein [Bacteroidales bacterium]